MDLRGPGVSGYRVLVPTATRAASVPWLVGTGLGLLGILVFIATPYESPSSSVVYGVVAALALLAMTAAMLRARPRLIWWLIWGYTAFTVAGDLVYTVQLETLGEVPRPGAADALYALGLATMVVALILLVRRNRGVRDAEAWVDTGIIVVALASVIGLFVLGPTVLQSEAAGAEIATAIFYVIADIVVLAGLIRLLIGARWLNLSLAILSVAIAATFTADLWQAYLTVHGSGLEFEKASDALFLAGIVALPIAAWAPGARRIDSSAVQSAGSITTIRLIGLGVGAISVPVLLVVAAVQSGREEYVVLAATAVIVVVLVLWRLWLVLAVAQNQSRLLAEEARTDPLTGLANRRTLDFHLERIDRIEGPTTLAMLDLDRFKDFNDRHGHQAGDELLVAVSAAWRATLPSGAILGRYGGEEFALLLPGTAIEASLPLLEAIRLAVPSGQTVSIGVAQSEGTDGLFATLRRADRALYEAKRTGRNKICIDRMSKDLR